MTARSAPTPSSGPAATPRWSASTARRKALAITTDCTPRYCYADPYEGGKQAIAEAYRNLCAVGARPLAVTNCLNFGNPQRPEIMAQFVGCLEGMGDACRALDFPIVSGNVSLYNESKATGGGSAILPTPAIGGVGLLDDWEKSATIGFKAEGEDILVICSDIQPGHVGQSLWLDVNATAAATGRRRQSTLDVERRAGEFVRELIAAGELSPPFTTFRMAALLVAIAEMALAGNVGVDGHVDLNVPNPAAVLFGEDQGRYVVTTSGIGKPSFARQALRVTPILLARTGGSAVGCDAVGTELGISVPLADLRAAHEGFFPALMQGEL